jgi:myo-inositol 2-dehydrogenase / D-chiro-inositol 1-dehydrogenase
MCAVVNLFRFPYRPGADGWRYRDERVGSWILEELVHHFDFLMWYFERWGDPVSVSAVGNARDGRAPGQSDNLAAVLRYRGPLYAVLTQTVAGFEYHLTVEITGSAGALRSWWSGAIDRTREPACGLTLRRRGRSETEAISVGASGELFELEEQLRQVVTAFGDRRPLVSAEEARKRVAVCLAVERSIREGCAIGLRF